MSVVAGTVTVADLPGAQELLSQAGSENFPVANALLGADVRRHLMAVYGYARLVDDVGDESTGDRLALLAVVESELDAIYAGGRGGRGPDIPQPTHPVMVQLARTIAQCDLPDGPFRRLIDANRVDQRVTRYETYAQLLQYCTLSANPVGEIVLGIFGVATPERIALSDRICTALQIAEHLQDIAEDHARGRIYLPAEDLIRFGCDDESLSATPTAPLRALIAFEARRARTLLAQGAPLALTLPARPRVAIAAFVAGGRAALDGLPGGGRHGGEGRPRPRALAFAPAFVGALAGR
jgi:squalene synthase HpnC